MDISADPVLNTGIETRSEWTKPSKIAELLCRIHSDLFNEEKHILNGVDLTVKLHRHKPEFCLLSDERDNIGCLWKIRRRTNHRNFRYFPEV